MRSWIWEGGSGNGIRKERDGNGLNVEFTYKMLNIKFKKFNILGKLTFLQNDFISSKEWQHCLQNYVKFIYYLFVHSLQSWGLNLDFVLTEEAVYH